MTKLYAMYLMNEEIMEFNATFNNIWAVSFIGGRNQSTRENRRPAASH
jgi:hypothetical protein